MHATRSGENGSGENGRKVTMRSIGRLAAAAVLAAAALLAATGGAWAEAELRGFGLVQERDSAARTLTIRDVVYDVPPSVEILDVKGRRTALAAIRSPRTRGERVGTKTADAVFFEATEVGERRVLVRLRMMESLPH